MNHFALLCDSLRDNTLVRVSRTVMGEIQEVTGRVTGIKEEQGLSDDSLDRIISFASDDGVHVKYYVAWWLSQITEIEVLK